MVWEVGLGLAGGWWGGSKQGKGAGCLAYQDFDVGILLELGDGGGLLVPCEVAEVVQEGDLLFVEHAADDAGQFDPVDIDFGTGLAGIGERGLDCGAYR